MRLLALSGPGNSSSFRSRYIRWALQRLVLFYRVCFALNVVLAFLHESCALSAFSQKLSPDEIWQSIRREGPQMLGCQFMLLYVYVERGILAVHNPETGVLEYLTASEAALAGQMFQEDNPKFISTRRQAEKLYDPSIAQVRVALDLDPSEVEDTRGHEVRAHAGPPYTNTMTLCRSRKLLYSMIATSVTGPMPRMHTRNVYLKSQRAEHY